MGFRLFLRISIARFTISKLYLYSTITDTEKEVVNGWEVGFVQEIWKRKKLDETWNTKLTPENTHVFLCGNPYMIDETIAMLEGEGFIEHKGKVKGQIHAEKW